MPKKTENQAPPNRFAQARREKNARLEEDEEELTQERVAHLVGSSFMTISRLETGATAHPRGELLTRLAKLYDKSTDWLLGVDAAATEETTLEVDELPALDTYRRWWKREYKAEMPKRYVDAVIGLARSDGPDAITPEVIDDLVKLRRAVERGKATSRPRDPENVVDVERGQTLVEPKTGPRAAGKRR